LILDSFALRNTYNLVNRLGNKNIMNLDNKYKVKIIKNNFPKFRYNKIYNITMFENNNFVADLERREIMNSILLLSSGVPVLWMIGGFLYFLTPPNNENNKIGIVALDKNGKEVIIEDWIKENPYPKKNLVQGLKGDAHYLIVNKENKLENYAINAVCTHLGCVVPFNEAANKFMCPCHGSQYDEKGKVIRGPAPKSLALAKTSVIDSKIVLSEYREKDFRSDNDPWWIK